MEEWERKIQRKEGKDIIRVKEEKDWLGEKRAKKNEEREDEKESEREKSKRKKIKKKSGGCELMYREMRKDRQKNEK